MELRPTLYRILIRPGWFTKYYIGTLICKEFDFTNKSVLEFGSGVGTNCQLFHPENYLGVDCDKNRVKYASRLFTQYRFVTISGPKLPIQNQTIDYILIISVLHHIKTEKIPDYLGEFQRVLKDSGIVIILEPCFQKCYGLKALLMSSFDRGKYIQDENGYLNIFERHKFKTEVVSRFTQLLVYRKILFYASPVK